MASIESLMATETITATPEETAAAVAGRMAQNDIGAVLVVDRGRLIGVFSERDLLVRVLAAGRDPAHTAVGEVCTHDPVTVDVGQTVKEVLAVFRGGRFRHLPVLRDGKPAGILSTRDFHEYLVTGFERYIDQLKYDSSLLGGADPYDHFGGGYER